ncbi:MAG: restriction endonuclease subunit S [Candidatus Moeniiplasma glomeromycotorum]|nr:restriction endonuclease subunit S [Candidatus Moeniiplasma glomeromycotorum]
MNKLDINNWKQFSLRDEKYFEIYSSKKGVILDDYTFSHIKSKSTIPVITSSGQNNGFVGFITKNDEEILYSKNTITIAKDGTHIAFSFFQPEEFYANPLVFILKVKCDNNIRIELVSFFICSIIKMEHPKYSYGRKLNIDNLLEIKILLPVNQKGEPDWLWIEDFSKKIFNKVKEDIIRLIDTEREREREQKLILIIEMNFKSVIIFMFLEPKPLKKKIFYQESLLI